MRKSEHRAFLSAALCALAVVYGHSDDVIAEELVTAFGADDLLRYAIETDDIVLPTLKETVRRVHEQRADRLAPSSPAQTEPKGDADAR